MSDQQPPAGTPEYLDSASGAPLSSPESTEVAPPAGKSRRTAWLVGGGLVAVLAVGAGAWAAVSFFSQGSQPAEALPSTTVAYVSVDLDPSGSQKIDAFRTLEKFPAFKDQVGIHSVDDVRQKLGDELIKGLGCDGMTFDDDIDPWLGNRAALAAVDTGSDEPQPVLVLQVSDDGKAQDSLTKLTQCPNADDDLAFDIHDGWAVFAQTKSTADEVVSETGKASLADDATYQKWTKAVGDAGVVNMYAAPSAGDFLAHQFGQYSGGFDGLVPGTTSTQSAKSAAYTSNLTVTPSSNEANTLLKNFKGAAATIRFTGDGLELATATDSGLTESNAASDQGGAAVTRLPDDTAAAIGIGLKSGWLQQYADRVGAATGAGSGQDLLDQISTSTGLDVPGDIETLLGSSTALSVGKDFDYEAAAMSNDGSGVPVALTVKGDSAGVEKVLDKLRARIGGLSTPLDSDSSGDITAIGPSKDYRQQVLAGGSLGETDAFTGVVPDADHASVVVYLNVDDLQKMLSEISAGDHELVDNIAPLQAIGFSGWTDDGIVHASLKISTD